MLRRILPLVEPSLFDESPELLSFVEQGDGDMDPILSGNDSWGERHDDETMDWGEIKKTNALVEHLFKLLGQRLFLDGGEKTGMLRRRLTASHKTSFMHNLRDGQVAFMESEEVLMLLRSLVESETSPQWSALITEAARQALIALPTLVDVERFSLIPEFYRRPQRLYHALSALCLLGGCVEGLRVGGRIEVPPVYSVYCSPHTMN